jgi:hypothetical protein
MIEKGRIITMLVALDAAQRRIQGGFFVTFGSLDKVNIYEYFQDFKLLPKDLFFSKI